MGGGSREAFPFKKKLPVVSQGVSAVTGFNCSKGETFKGTMSRRKNGTKTNPPSPYRDEVDVCECHCVPKTLCVAFDDLGPGQVLFLRESMETTCLLVPVSKSSATLEKRLCGEGTLSSPF